MTIGRNSLYEFLFVLCVAMPYFNVYELTFIVWLFAVLLTVRKSYPKGIWQQATIFGVIALIAFCSGVLGEYRTFDFIKDITYFVKPVLGMLIGYQIARSYLPNPMRSIVRAGVAIASVHLCIVVFAIVFSHVRNIHELRGEAGYFSDFEIYALLILIFSNAFELHISREAKIKYLIILILSSFCYLSRVNMIQFILLFAALKGFFEMRPKAVIGLMSVITAAILFYVAILYINPKRNGEGLEAFLYKIKIAPIEAFKTKIDRDDWKDFNDNYRSLETILVVQQNSDETGRILFGKGFGSVVDLHQKVELDGNEMQYISIAHNGFSTVYFKAGIAGIILLITSIVFLRRIRTGVYEDRYLNYLVAGTVVYLFFSYWVFLGFYFKADTKSIIVGVVMAVLQKRAWERRQASLIAT